MGLLSYFHPVVFPKSFFDASIHPNHNASQSTPPPNLDATTTGNYTIEIDSSSAPAISGDQQGSKGIGKLVQTVRLGVAATSIVLFVNLPLPVSHDFLFASHVICVCLALFTSLGLSMYSILKPTQREAVRIQKMVMVIAISSELVAFMLRTCIVLPAVFFLWVWLVVLFGAGLVWLCVRVAWKEDS